MVQIAAHELGLAVDDPARPLTLTGGLTFGGGPGNNYTSHGIAQVPSVRCEPAPGTAALVDRASAGTPPSTRSGVYASRPPRGRRRAVRLAQRPDRGRCAARSARSTQTATGRRAGRDLHRDLRPRRRRRNVGIVACRTAADARAWGNVTDADTLAQLCVEEGIGRTGVLAEDGVLVLDD